MTPALDKREATRRKRHKKLKKQWHVMRLHLRRYLRYPLEALLVFSLLALCRLLPLDVASAFGGFLARCVGPYTSAHRTAVRNMQRFLPEASPQQRQTYLREMWDNLGRTAAELPHINRPLMRQRMQVEQAEWMETIRNHPEQPVLFFSGHLGNWELAPKTAYMYGVPIELVYRPANNPYVEWLIQTIRKGSYRQLYTKGAQSAVKLTRALKQGGKVGLLIDQKMNDGIAIPFLGTPAMTSTAAAELALRYGAWLVPAQVIRTGGAHFRIIVHPPFTPQACKPTDQQKYDLTLQMNQQLENWIQQRPGQWFWVHNRWPKENQTP